MSKYWVEIIKAIKLSPVSSKRLHCSSDMVVCHAFVCTQEAGMFDTLFMLKLICCFGYSSNLVDSESLFTLIPRVSIPLDECELCTCYGKND